MNKNEKLEIFIKKWKKMTTSIKNEKKMKKMKKNDELTAWKGFFGYETPPEGAPQGVTTTFWGQNNIKNEFSTIKLLKCKFSAKSDNF